MDRYPVSGIRPDTRNLTCMQAKFAFLAVICYVMGSTFLHRTLPQVLPTDANSLSSIPGLRVRQTAQESRI